MQIALITDIHFGRDTNIPKLLGDDYVNLFGSQFSELFTHTKEDFENADLVVNLGDFIHDESEESDLAIYTAGLEAIKTKTRTIHVAGNHDLRNISRETLAHLIDSDDLYYSFDSSGYHHIVLDGSRRETRGPHYIPQEQLLWIEADLEKTSHRTIVYCHFPIDNQDMGNNYYFKDAPEMSAIANRLFVRRVFEKSGKVIAVFSGHTHFFNKQIVNDITYCTVPSFSENDGGHKPSGAYVIANIDDTGVKVEIRTTRTTS